MNSLQPYDRRWYSGDESRLRGANRISAGSSFLPAIVCTLLVVAAARADQWPWASYASQPQPAHPAVARIIVEETNGSSLGSGTLVDVRDRWGLVVTNWHVVRDATGAIRVVFPDGFRSAARVLKVDRDWDLAALLIWRPRAAPVPLASEAPRPGDPLTIAGYGPGNYRAATGKCTQYVAPGRQQPFEMVEVSVSARQGDSGGPIFNDRGQLAGVLFGSGGGATSGSYAGRVGWFLQTAWPPEVDTDPTRVAAGKMARPAAPYGANDSPRVERMSPATRLAELPARSREEVAGPLKPMAPVSPSRHTVDRDAPAGGGQFRRGAVQPPLPIARTSEISWGDIAGETAYEQLKTVLAAIGLLAIFVQLTRRKNADAQK